MPTYEWSCATCGRREDGFRTVAERHDSPTCHGQRMGIVISVAGVQADLPGYQSPTTGRWIEGRAARREDLKRSGARPWEGLDQEKKEAQKRLAERESKSDAKLEKVIRETYHALPPAKRRALETP